MSRRPPTRPVGWASSGPASWCLSPDEPQSFEERKPCGNRPRAPRRRGAACRTKRTWNGVEPHGRQRPQRSRSVQGGNRRGGEKPRGRNVPGEATPGEADLQTHVVVGAREPQEGRPWPRGRGRDTRWSALRGAQACGSCFGRRPEASRPSEDLEAVETARRERQTNDAATTDGGMLREARQPCEGGPRGGDDLSDGPRAPRTPGGAIGDLPERPPAPAPRVRKDSRGCSIPGPVLRRANRRALGPRLR